MDTDTGPISLADCEPTPRVRKKSVVPTVEETPVVTPPPVVVPDTNPAPLDPAIKPVKKKGSYRIIPSDTSGPLNVGSIRMRLFKALAREGANPGDGLTHREIQTMTEIPGNSGSLGIIIIQEVKRGRLLVSITESTTGSRAIRRYRLSAFGKRDFDRGQIDGGKHAGHRIGTPWTDTRRKIEDQKKESDLSSL